MGPCVSCLFKTETQEENSDKDLKYKLISKDQEGTSTNGKKLTGLGAQYVPPTKKEIEEEQAERDEAIRNAVEIVAQDSLRRQQAQNEDEEGARTLATEMKKASEEEAGRAAEAKIEAEKKAEARIKQAILAAEKTKADEDDKKKRITEENIRKEAHLVEAEKNGEELKQRLVKAEDSKAREVKVEGKKVAEGKVPEEVGVNGGGAADGATREGAEADEAEGKSKKKKNKKKKR